MPALRVRSLELRPRRTADLSLIQAELELLVGSRFMHNARHSASATIPRCRSERRNRPRAHGRVGLWPAPPATMCSEALCCHPRDILACEATVCSVSATVDNPGFSHPGFSESREDAPARFRQPGNQRLLSMTPSRALERLEIMRSDYRRQPAPKTSPMRSPCYRIRSSGKPNFLGPRLHAEG